MSGNPGLDSMIQQGVAKALSNPSSLPASFWDYALQYQANNSVPSNVRASLIASSGTLGATAASRYVGATTSGSPPVGKYVKGDFIIDQTAAIWVCTVAGEPGTWVKIGGGSGLPWAYYETTSFSITSDTNYHAIALTMDDSSDTGILDTANGPDGVAGIKFVAEGIYQVNAVVTFFTGSPAANSSASARWTNVAYYPLASDTGLSFEYSAKHSNYFSQPSVSGLFNVSSTGDFAPGTSINLEITQDSGSTLLTGTVQAFVTQISPTGSSGF